MRQSLKPTPLNRELRRLRAVKGQTTRQVEAAIGIKNGHLSALERGIIANPTARTLCRLSEHYNVPIAHFMHLAGFLSIPVDNAITPQNEGEKQAVAACLVFYRRQRKI